MSDMKVALHPFGIKSTSEIIYSLYHIMFQEPSIFFFSMNPRKTRTIIKKRKTKKVEKNMNKRIEI